MNKHSIVVPDVYTKPDDVCYGMISVYVQEGEKSDLTSSKAQHLEKYVPVLRAICYHAPVMYRLLRKIAKSSKSPTSYTAIVTEAKDAIKQIDDSIKGYDDRIEYSKWRK